MEGVGVEEVVSWCSFVYRAMGTHHGPTNEGGALRAIGIVVMESVGTEGIMKSVTVTGSLHFG